MEYIIPKKILGISLCILLIGASLPLVSSTENSQGIALFNSLIDHEIITSSFYQECNCSNQTQTYSLGCRALPEWIPSTQVVEPAEFLTELDWRNYYYNDVSGNWLTSVKNQGNCGSCWAFAAIGCLEAMINIAGNNPNIDLDLSEQYLVSCVTSADGCNGGNAYNCYQYMKDETYPNDGALPESCFPYTSGSSGSEPSCSSKCSDWTNKLVKTITNFGQSSGSSQIKARLSKGPVCLSFDVYSDFKDYTGGVYKHTYGVYLGIHQVVCVGYSDSGGYWICKNSWGSAWGEGGYFKIKYGECYIESELVYCDFFIGNLPPNTPSNPTPSNHATNIDFHQQLSWICSDPNPGDTVTYDVYFGTSASGPKVSSDQSGTTYNPGVLSKNTKYYWRIIATDFQGEITSSPIWDFTTKQDNNPPNTPSTPYPFDQATDVDINTELTWTGGDPNTDDTVTYDIYFGSMPPFKKIASNITTTSFTPGTLNHSLTYFWKIIAWDNHGLSTESPTWHFTTINTPNNPPNKPNTPVGETDGKVKLEYTYTTTTTDPESNQVFYLWDWGDGNISGWLGPYQSGITIDVTYTWAVKGSYIIKVKAKDLLDQESPWSDPLPITMPYSHNLRAQFLELLLQRFPHTFPILRLMLGY